MGQWRGAMFKEYIQEELALYAYGISYDIKEKVGFVSIVGHVFHDIPKGDLNGLEWVWFG